MIKLGLIGGTGPESTVAYYKEIEYGVQQKSAEKNFPNIVFENLSKKSPIPLVSMIVAARNFVRKQGWDKIGLLGTLPTMNGDFFQNSFAEYVFTPRILCRKRKCGQSFNIRLDKRG